METASESLAPVGHNRGLPAAIIAEEDLPAQVTAYLDEEFARLPKQVNELLDKARALPKTIEDDVQMADAANLIKGFRDLTRELESHHASEKAPYFRSAQSVDGFFFGLWDKCVKRSKTAKPGAADVLQSRVDDYAQRKLRIEQERRAKEEAAARAKAEQLRREQEAAERKAEEDRLAAERARLPTTSASKGALAALSEDRAAEARVEADLAAQRAQEAHIDTLAKPADMIRTRTDGGAVMTMGTESFAIVEDYAALDLEKLRPFISEKALDAALVGWAKVTGYNQPMAGASIGKRPKTQIR